MGKKTKKKARRRPAKLDIEVLPFRIIVDTREQHPYRFDCHVVGHGKKQRSLYVRTIRGGLATGDYSIEGMGHLVSVERKSLADAYGTFGHGRDRWIRELERLERLRVAVVVVEADWASVRAFRRPASSRGRRFTPEAFEASVTAWQQRYQGVHWEFCSTRLLAEERTLRHLTRFWRDAVEQAKQSS